MSKESIYPLNDDNDLLSEEVQDIISSVPPWIVRCGISLIFLVLIAIIGFTFLIKYPDIIIAEIVVTSENPPVSIVAQASGKIENLFVKNGESVSVGQELAVIDNTANYKDIKDLNTKIDKLSINPLDNLSISFSDHYSLGSIQSAFSEFYIRYIEFKNFLELDLSGRKISTLETQLKSFANYITRLKTQENYQNSILELNNINYKRDSSLYISKVISASEFEKSKQNLLTMKNSLESYRVSIDNNQMSMDKVKYEILDIKNQDSEKMNQMITSMNSSLEKLKNHIVEWKKNNLLISPISGRITFTKYWTINQFVYQSNPVFTIVPANSSKIIGRVKLPIAGSGKVKRGQYANIKFDNFPYMEYGIVNAKLESISLVPEIDELGTPYYTAEVSFPNSLNSSYKILLPFNQKMQGSAEIITNDLTLFDRLIQPLKSKIEY